MRSLLFVPADSEKKIAKSITSEADAVVFDLEDSISTANKSRARDHIAEFLNNHDQSESEPKFYVRINDLTTPYWREDLEKIVPTHPHGLLLPKARSGADIETLCKEIDTLEKASGLQPGTLDLMALITETAESLLNMPSFVGCNQRLTAMTWGAEDLSAEIGAKANRDSSGRFTDIYGYARTQTLIVSAAAGCLPLDTVYVDFRNSEGLRAEALEACRDGFLGKFAIHPNQIGIINEVFTPTSEEIAHAEAVVAAFSEAGDVGVTSLDGKMLDRPHLVNAQRLLSRVKDIVD